MKLIRVWRHKFGGRPARTMAVVFTPLIALAKNSRVRELASFLHYLCLRMQGGP